MIVNIIDTIHMCASVPAVHLVATALTHLADKLEKHRKALQCLEGINNSKGKQSDCLRKSHRLQECLPCHGEQKRLNTDGHRVYLEGNL